MTEEIQAFLHQRILDNKVENIIFFALIILFGFILKRLIAQYLSKVIYFTIKKDTDKNRLDLFLSLLKRPVELLLVLMFLYTAFSFLIFPKAWNMTPIHKMGLKLILLKGYQLSVIASITWILLRLIDFFGALYKEKAAVAESRMNEQLVTFFKEMTKILTVVFSFFFVLGAVFKLNVGSLIAGLGIGGLAVALAGKETLENLFASFTIFLDKPFIVGDLVQVGNTIGTVEKVGFRSTRIRTLEKSFLTLPNKQMIDLPLDNLTLRTFRRSKYNIGLTYDTPPEKIRAIVDDIQLYFNTHPRLNDEAQARFLEFGESALIITLLYFVDTMDYAEFTKIKEEINFKIIEIVKRYNCQFAFPSTSIYFQDREVASLFLESNKLINKN